MTRLAFSMALLMMSSNADARRSDSGTPVTVRVLDTDGEPVAAAVVRNPEEASRHRVNEITGEERPVGIWEFATDGGHYAAAGMAPVGFGPGDPYLAHTIDEHIELDQLGTAMEANRRLALELPVSLADREPE